MIYDLALGKI